MRMHADELSIDEHAVRRLLAAQFPDLARLPICRVPSSGTVNAIFRLGDELAVRAPFVPGDAGVEREALWSPRLAPLLPVRVPRILGVGSPSDEYPSPWLVVDWIPGETPASGGLREIDPLVEFIRALRALDPTGAPASHRNGVLAQRDAGVREALGRIWEADTEVLLRIWERALAVGHWPHPPVWVHADLLPSNVLVDGRGRLAAVIDMVPGAADPATELICAWNLVAADKRAEFRSALGVDDDEWDRGRGWTLLQATMALPYYRDTNQGMTDMAVHALRELVADAA
jgi:aminoglycoside phosphotransferase (APT) family kinase protein